VTPAAVGVIANPASGRDVRRLVAGASVFDNAEKGAMVYRLMVGLGAVGVERVVMMPAGSGLSEALRRMLQGRDSSSGADLPELELLDMRLRGTAEDTVEAVGAMVEQNVAAIAVLGGDGTNRVVAGSCGEVPLCPISTGTNNAFPELRESTVAGLAAGLLATGTLGAEALRREKILRVTVNAERKTCALVDVARTREPWVGARALWRPEAIEEAVIAFGEPRAVGLSALAGLLDPVPRQAPHGLHLILGDPATAPVRLRAPLAPGLMAEVGVRESRPVACGKTVVLEAGAGSLALDGERELELAAGDRVEVTLGDDGPVVVDVDAAMREAARRGLLTERDGA
jgi:predicted polyphosphate/ATP-dependent NAD kinase